MQPIAAHKGGQCRPAALPRAEGRPAAGGAGRGDARTERPQRPDNRDGSSSCGRPASACAREGRASTRIGSSSNVLSNSNSTTSERQSSSGIAGKRLLALCSQRAKREGQEDGIKLGPEMLSPLMWLSRKSSPLSWVMLITWTASPPSSSRGNASDPGVVPQYPVLNCLLSDAVSDLACVCRRFPERQWEHRPFL